MLRRHLLAAVCSCALVTYVIPAAAVTIDYSNTANSAIVFNPTDSCLGGGEVGCFSFTPTIGGNIKLTSGTATNAVGTISGTFGVGTISVGPPQTAPVSGTGALSIFDGAFTLTATLDWVDIFTFGVVGGINVQGSANLSSISYAGTNPDLVALATSGGGSGTQTASFQFDVPKSLTDLFSGSATTPTSFSGSLGAVPVPPAVWLFGSGLLGLVGIARRRSS